MGHFIFCEGTESVRIQRQFIVKENPLKTEAPRLRGKKTKRILKKFKNHGSLKGKQPHIPLSSIICHATGKYCN